MQRPRPLVDKFAIVSQFVEYCSTRHFDFSQASRINSEFICTLNEVTPFFKSQNKGAVLPNNVLQQRTKLRLKRLSQSSRGILFTI